jgi:very-short-patch-repair endonuclease
MKLGSGSEAQEQTRPKIIQIFRYLQALNQIRNPPQRNFDPQAWTLWFHDLPIHPCISHGIIIDATSRTDTETIDNDNDFILKISRPRLGDPPQPPKEIRSWLQEGWEEVDGSVAVKPPVADSNGVVTRFEDNPQRLFLLEEWKAKRAAWVETERPARRTMAIFEKLYALQSQFERESERLELMLGDGRIRWRTHEGFLLDYPVLLLRLQLLFDPKIPEFTLIETGQPSEFYTAIFQSIAEVNASAIGRCRDNHEQGEWHPLGGEETTNFFRRLVSQLSPYGELIEQGLPKKTTVPSIARDPVIFVRPRTLGISTALESILEILPQIDHLPYSLISLVGITGTSNERQDTLTAQQMLDAPNGEDEHILLSKPANAEQLEIARRLERNNAVLVQGPPGTGKTHTIANLIGHLLAQGKSVLVTSEKPKALRVLREKVVEPLQPLCVSILEDDSRKNMESTIDAISERLASSNSDRLDREAAALTGQRLELLRQLREARQKLLEARGSEYRSLIVAGESYSPTEAARYIAQHRTTDSWIPGPATPGATLPLSRSELIELYNTNAKVTIKEEREMGLSLPDPEKLLSPVDFERMLTEQVQLNNATISYRHDLWLPGSYRQSTEALQELQKRLVQEVEPIRELTGWRLAAIIAGREGGPRRQAWEDLLQEIQQAYTFATQAQLRILRYDPAISPTCPRDHIDKILDEIAGYLSQGGKLNGFKLLTKREWKAVIESTTVKGRQPETVEHFEALGDLVRLYMMRGDLVGRWQRQMSVLGGPGINEFGPEPERTFYQYVDPLRRCLHWFANTWAPLERELRQQGFQWDAFLAEMPVEHNEHSEGLRLRMAVVEKLPAVIAAERQRRAYTRINERFLELERYLEQGGSNLTQAEVLLLLRDAVKRRDPHAYRAAYSSLLDFYAKHESLQRRRALLAKLEKVAPGWATAIRERIGNHGERGLPGEPEKAWLWRQLYDELDRLARLSLEDIQDRINRLSKELFTVTADLVEKRAWAQQIRRTSLEQRRALQGWRELMRKVGKGTGKRAPRLLAEARKLIPICQTAVPVWIMPLSYVARNFDMKRNRFDVVIIDEASQADITALMAVYMGDQVVVVGDDEQVSPTAVGQRVDEIDHLIDEHLRGIPLANMYDGKLSIYSLARTTFEPVCLLEHFRCVSPIIQFSNELSYQGKIKPLRDDSEVLRRPFTVAYQVKSLSRSGKVNKEEAFAVASLLIAASEQPEYKDATFGVISMVGSEQALYIESLLRKYMPATEYVQRRVLCGDPAQFQGDERDVMFLSMVDVPEGDGPLPLRNEEGNEYMFKKRFNVAASRARDQIWVVYSLDPSTDLKPGDIRRRLILHARDQHLHNQVLKEQEQKIESEFERQVLQRLVKAGYRVTTQWPVGAYRIDLVVEGAGRRLAIECDGERWHSAEKLGEDMARQAILERLGWRFVRIRGSQFFRNPDIAIEPVFTRLRALDIPPEGSIAQNSGDPSGQELKNRLIRRADELRGQWKESTDHPEAVSSRSQNRDTESERLITSGNASGRTSLSGTTAGIPPLQKTSVSRPIDTPLPQPRQERQATDGRIPNQALRHDGPTHYSSGASPQSSQSPQFNLILFLQTKGLRVIDNREKGGGVWVVGGSELSPVMQALAAKGIHFKLYPGGLQRQLGPKASTTDGWFIKSL